MFSKEKVEEIITATLVADSYSLVSHWVYDAQQLEELDVNWEELNAPCAKFHKGKMAGDFTHIGDQEYWLKEFLKDKDVFDEVQYLRYWQEKMSNYEGYFDGATKETLENIKNGKFIGSNSEDFSVIGRITPLLLVSKNENEFIKNVQSFIRLSHNSDKVVGAATFFAQLLFRVQDGQNIKKEILSLKDDFNRFVVQSVQDGVASKKEETSLTLRKFGLACGINQGFSGIIHLLCKYPNNLKELLVENAKAGGDTSSRAMVATMIIVANSSSEGIPENWFHINKK
jgi:ADP-ribosylglycohydrolase